MYIHVNTRYKTNHLVDLQRLATCCPRICRLLHDTLSNTEIGRDTANGVERGCLAAFLRLSSFLPSLNFLPISMPVYLKGTVGVRELNTLHLLHSSSGQEHSRFTKQKQKHTKMVQVQWECNAINMNTFCSL